MTDNGNELVATQQAATQDAEAEWGTPGEHCYCTTGSSDYCEFCDSWVGKCWCWDDEDDDD